MASKAHHKRILMDYGFSQRRSWSIIREFERITDFLKLRSYSHNLPSNHFLSQRSEIASGSGTLGSDLLLPFRWSFCPKSKRFEKELNQTEPLLMLVIIPLRANQKPSESPKPLTSLDLQSEKTVTREQSQPALSSHGFCY